MNPSLVEFREPRRETAVREIGVPRGRRAGLLMIAFQTTEHPENHAKVTPL